MTEPDGLRLCATGGAYPGWQRAREPLIERPMSSNDARDELAHIRADLERADTDLVRALDVRATAVSQLKALRERDPSGYHALPPTAEVLARAQGLRKALPERALDAIVREVLNASAAMLAPQRVAILGPEGGLTHLAARRHFGALAQFEAVGSIAEVFASVQRRVHAVGVVPLESSAEGTLAATLAGLVTTEARITAELRARAAYHLYSRTGNLGDVDKIVAPPSILAACAQTLRAKFGRMMQLEMKTGALAAKVASEDHGAAALGPELLGDSDLRVVASNLEDDPSMETRFAVIGEKPAQRSGHDRTVLALAIGETPGSLYAALAPFAERGINLTRLESRHIPGTPYREIIFVDLDGHVSDRPVVAACEEVRGKVRHLEVLGSFPRPRDEPG